MPEPNPFAARLPVPSNAWVAWEPRFWPAPHAMWTAVASGRVGCGDGQGERLPAQVPAQVDDVVLLPPVSARGKAGRDALAGRLAQLGVPHLVQILAAGAVEAPDGAEVAAAPEPADSSPGGAATGTGTVLWDPLSLLLAGAEPALLAAAAERAPRGAVGLWPLLGGLADCAALTAVATGLRAAGVDVLLPVRVEPDDTARRLLTASLDPARWELVFHRQPAAERGVLSAIVGAGLRWWMPRPAAPASPGRRLANRELASQLLVASELALRLGRSPGWAAELARVARRLERLPHDVRTLWLEGNLGVLDFVSDEAVAEIDGWCTRGRLPALVALEEELCAVANNP